MPDNTVLASDFAVEVETAPETWTLISGLTSIQVNSEATPVDTGNFDSPGWKRSRVVSRGLTLTLEGQGQYDDTGVQDEGQSFVNALGHALGRAAVGNFRVAQPGGLTHFYVTATASVTEFGGSFEDVSTWSCELTVVDPPTIQ